MSDERLKELADRLVAPGPKCCAVSASETHEIRDGLLELVAERDALLRTLNEVEAVAEEAGQDDIVGRCAKALRQAEETDDDLG